MYIPLRCLRRRSASTHGSPRCRPRETAACFRLHGDRSCTSPGTRTGTTTHPPPPPPPPLAPPSPPSAAPPQPPDRRRFSSPNPSSQHRQIPHPLSSPGPRPAATPPTGSKTHRRIPPATRKTTTRTKRGSSPRPAATASWRTRSPGP